MEKWNLLKIWRQNMKNKQKALRINFNEKFNIGMKIALKVEFFMKSVFLSRTSKGKCNRHFWFAHFPLFACQKRMFLLFYLLLTTSRLCEDYGHFESVGLVYKSLFLLLINVNLCDGSTLPV
jgi:hypothetical protein